jgi:hypothetical protein
VISNANQPEDTAIGTSTADGGKTEAGGVLPARILAEMIGRSRLFLRGAAGSWIQWQ